MKKTWIKLTIILLLSTIPFQKQSIVKASEVSVGVVVERNFTADDRFTLELRVNKGGYVIDGSAWISEGIIAYELPVATEKSFQVKCEKGYKLKSITFEQPEIDVSKSLLSELKEDTFNIHTVSTKTIVTVEFEKDPNDRPDPEPSPNPEPTPGDEPSDNGGTKDGPSTGDNTDIQQLFTVCIGAFLLLVFIKKKKQKDTYNA